MFVLIRHFISSCSTSINLSEKKIFNFFNIFLIRFFFAFNFIRNLKKKNFFLIKSSNLSNYFKKKQKISKVLNDLNIYGFNDNLRLKNNFIDKIKKDINLKNSSIFFKSNTANKKFIKSLKKNNNLNEIFNKTKKYKVPHVVLNINLKKTIYIKKLARTKFLVDLAKNYINTNKISISGQCFISNPIKISEMEKKDNAQYFHYDNDFKKFFKIFIYLNNVGSKSGPHVFLPYSHKKKFFKHIITQRLNDIEINKTYKNKFKIFEGKKGYVIIEDTFGLHKGNAPTSKSRLMLVLIYGYGKGINLYKDSIFID